MRSMWKKLGCLLLALTVSAGAAAPGLAAERLDSPFPVVKELGERQASRTFPDVQPAAWYYADMTALVRSGGINGYEDGLFRPNGKLKLCEFLKILTAILYPEYLSLFTDSTVEGKQTWYAPYAALAEYVGLTKGVDHSKQALESRVSRFDMAVIAGNAARLLGQEPEDQPAICYLIGDYPSVPEEYQEAVRTAYNEGILMGRDEKGRFCGGDSLTRAEACTVAVRLFRESARAGTATELLALNDDCMLAVTMPRDWRDRCRLETGAGEEGLFSVTCACAAGGEDGVLFVLSADPETRTLAMGFPADGQCTPDSPSAGEYVSLLEEARAGAVTARLIFPAEADWDHQWSYTPKEAAGTIGQYTAADIPANERVSILTLQMEAYADFSGFGIQGLSPGVYADYHALLAKSYHGTLVTNVFAGDTTETEWSVLTGRNDHAGIDIAPSTDSYAWYFRDQGYRVTGAHPSHQEYYDRNVVNAALGFTDYLFMENYFGAISDDPNVAYDDIFFPDLEKRLKRYFAGDSTPLFSFNVTYQGHGPYKDNLTYWGDSYCTGPYSFASRNILNNYFAIIQESMGYVRHLTDWLSTLDRPVVLVLYGDHKPWLGNGNSVYRELGVNLDTSTTDGFYNYYSTEYLFWANDAAKRALGCSFTGEGPTLSPCFLMDQLFTLCGWDGPAYMQAQHQTKACLPVLHTGGWYLENGVLTRDLSPAGQSAADRFRNLARWDFENGRP